MEDACNLDNNNDLRSILERLTALREDVLSTEENHQNLLHHISETYRDSARNLLHYLAFRKQDLRPLQYNLSCLGLSSLGRAESHVLEAVENVIKVLQRLLRLPTDAEFIGTNTLTQDKGNALLNEHTTALFGQVSSDRKVRIMVTMPSEAADDYLLIYNLVKQGMDCMRINCAHDEPVKWGQMIRHLQKAKEELGKPCKIIMDLAGPKLRTGPLQPGPAVTKIQPQRDELGRMILPARVWLYPANTVAPPPSHADATLPILGELSLVQTGDQIEFLDSRSGSRTMTVVDTTALGCWALIGKTAYIVPGTTVFVYGQAGTYELEVGDFPPVEQAILLNKGDTIILFRDETSLGRPALYDAQGKVLTPAMIGCTLPEVFNYVKSGERIWFDDGKIGGNIEKILPNEVHVRITQTRIGGAKLRSDKGINLPDSELQLAAMPPKDVQDLAFIAQHADMVALSFVNGPEDVEKLQEYLEQLGDKRPGIVLKIETRRGFDNLPMTLLAATKAPNCGVMIARGDLAVECGFERLAEVQEEILWICEAAHVPVIWATQVLETLAKTGLPSRAEITDAAMAHRAECVMLNKGPHILEAVQLLDDILLRMQAHQNKKRSMLRGLRLAQGFRVKN